MFNRRGAANYNKNFGSNKRPKNTKFSSENQQKKKNQIIICEEYLFLCYGF